MKSSHCDNLMNIIAEGSDHSREYINKHFLLYIVRSCDDQYDKTIQ